MEGGEIFSANGHRQTGLVTFWWCTLISIDFPFSSAGNLNKKCYNPNSLLTAVLNLNLYSKRQ